MRIFFGLVAVMIFSLHGAPTRNAFIERAGGTPAVMRKNCTPTHQRQCASAYIPNGASFPNSSHVRRKRASDRISGFSRARASRPRSRSCGRNRRTSRANCPWSRRRGCQAPGFRRRRLRRRVPGWGAASVENLEAVCDGNSALGLILEREEAGGVEEGPLSGCTHRAGFPNSSSRHKRAALL